MTYIYLNTYSNGYLYVGSHTWSGQGIDDTYYGSSKVATHYNWLPSKIEILEVVSEERKYVAEREWIERYCSLFGIADCALQFKNEWTKNYKSHGLMLNLHSNTMEQYYAKGRQSINSNKYLCIEKSRKAYQTQLNKGQIEKFRQASADSLSKMLDTKSRNGVHKTAAVKRSLNYKSSSLGHPHLLKVVINGVEFKGSAYYLLKVINSSDFKRHLVSLCYRARKYKEFEFLGYNFEVIK